MRKGAQILFLLAVAVSALWNSAEAQTPPAPAPVPAAAQGVAGQPFDVKAAVDAYLATIPADKRARSDAYFEGGYWLVLWDFLVIAGVMWLMLRWRISAKMRDWAEHVTRFRVLQTAIYWLQFFLLFSLVTFPWEIYESYFREHKYGLLNQTFGPWMRDQLVMLAVNTVLGAVFLVILFGLIRRLGKNWWVWGAVFSVLFLAFASLIAPVFIFPLFNKFTKLEDPRIKGPILSMARANGVPASEVYVFDASRQSDRVSANVSGFAGTMRISLNDNLLKRCSLPAIESTMGHEMGHYVLNHAYKNLALNGIVIVIAFAFLNWGTNAALARWGNAWEVRGITDVAVLPLAVLLFSIFSLVTTPVNNTITRTMEYEADMYGLNAGQQPDGEAEVDLLLGEYRKLDPGPVEEFIFFDHPSGRTRITAAMRWKAEHLPAAAVQVTPSHP
jgi:STE24 endopeptidase